MKSDRFKLIPSVYLLLVDGDSILLSRRFQTGYEDGNYGLVAGHAEGGETFREALVREAFEEAGIRVEPGQLEHAHTMHRWCGDHERVDFFFTTPRWSGNIENREPSKCDDLAWFPLEHLPENTIVYIRAAIGWTRIGTPYSEVYWENRKL